MKNLQIYVENNPEYLQEDRSRNLLTWNLPESAVLCREYFRICGFILWRFQNLPLYVENIQNSVVFYREYSRFCIYITPEYVTLCGSNFMQYYISYVILCKFYAENIPESKVLWSEYSRICRFMQKIFQIGGLCGVL